MNVESLETVLNRMPHIGDGNAKWTFELLGPGWHAEPP